MQKIDQTIEKLLNDVKPVKPLPRPSTTFTIWASLTLLATLILASFSTLRPDLSQQFHNPLFVTEVITLLLLIGSLALTAIWLSFPDMRQKPKILYLPLAPFAVFLACTIYRSLHPETNIVLTEDADNGMACVLCITMYSLVPGFWMFRTLRRHATTHPMLAGALSLLASACIGLLVLKFLEGNDSFSHLMEWHISPIILIGMIGTFIGKKFLRW